MATKTTDEEFLKCFIFKFRKDLNLSEVKHIHPCLKFRIVALLYKNDTIRFVKICNGKRDLAAEAELNVKDLTRFLWSSEEGDHQQQDVVQQTAKFAVLRRNLELSTYAVSDGTVQQEICQNLQNVEGLKVAQLGEGSEIDILSYEEQHVIIRAEGEILTLQLKTEDCRVISRIQIPDQGATFQICQDVVVIFDSRTTIYSFYNLYTGELLATLNMTQTILQNLPVVLWKFTDDLKNLVYLDSSMDLWAYNIQTFCEENISCVKLHGNHGDVGIESDWNTYRTSQIGDPHWKSKLLMLFERHKIKQGNQSWYKPCESGDQVLQRNFRLTQKRKKRISGFKPEKSDPKEGYSDYVTAKLTLPSDMAGQRDGLQMVTSQTGATLLTKQSIMCVCDLSSGKIRSERLDADCQISLSMAANYPHLVVTDTHLVCIVVSMSNDQEEFVSKMMTYAGASIADTVCHLNRWGRCAVPINTLDIGLKHRQLDTVSFFLKSKENLFSGNSIAPPTSPSGTDQPSPWKLPAFRYYDNLLQLEPALSLLIQTTRENTADIQSLSFSRKLADITLDFLYKLLFSALNQSDSLKPVDGSQSENSMKGNQSESEDLQKAIDKLLQMISELRECVGVIERKSVFQIDTGNSPSKPNLQEEIVSDLKGDTLQEIIESGVIENKISGLQTYLYQAGETYNFDAILHTCMCQVLQYLSEKKIEPATVLLFNLGLPVNDRLWNIASLTFDPDTRDFIVEELRSRNGLSSEQEKMVEFVHTLERDLRKPTSYKEQAYEQDVLQRLIVSDDEEMVQNRLDISEMADENTTILLDWVQHWDQDTRDLVLYQTSDQASESDSKLPWRLYLKYLCRYNKKSELLNFVSETAKVDEPASHQLVKEIQGCSKYIQDIVHQEMARSGIFQDTSDFQEMMKQLFFVGGPLHPNHPLENCIFYPVENFHEDFLMYCAKNNLHNLIWTYCAIQRISPDVVFKILPNVSDNLWLPLFANYCKLSNGFDDPQVMYETSLANALMAYGSEAPSAFSLLQQEKTTAALATMMYSSACVHQILSNSVVDMESREIEKALKSYPKLHSTLYPSSPVETPVNDVTVYMLLKNNAAFEPSRLFGWQKMNTLISEECSRIMPHFSSQELVSKYGHTENIRYTYYLKQGRPSFAALSFLAEEINSDSPEIPSQRLVAASNTAVWIGICNFHNAQIACSCVTFLEMLGQDSLLLRTLLQVGQEILVFLNDSLTGNSEQRKEQAKNCDDQIVSWLCNCVMYREKHAEKLRQHLERAITASLEKDKIPSTSFEAGQKWLIAVLFCQQLQLPLSTKFLEACARADKWLPFLWFAQVHQFSKDQLQSVLYMFKSKHLQQHLHYVIENAEIKAQNAASAAVVQQQKTDSKAKDVRSTLYARIGLAKETQHSDESSSEDEDRGHPNVPPQISEEEEMDQITLIDKAALPDDLFSVVFAAQSSRIPWKTFLLYAVILRNPILAELAACFKESSVLPCLCGWLVAMMSERVHEKMLKDHGKVIWKWNIKQLGLIIDIYLQQDWGSTLATGFNIYQPESPLLPFLKFSAAITEKIDYAQSKLCLEEFKESMYNYNHDDSKEMQKTVIGNSDWLQQTTYRIIQHHFHHVQNHMCLLQMLKLLDTQNIILIFKFDVVNFGRLSRMLQVVVSAQVEDVKFTSFVSQDASEYEEECRKVINKMVERKLFHDAKHFANDCGIACISDEISIQEICSEKEKLQALSLWKSYTARRKFWLHCEEFLNKEKVSSTRVATFFQTEADDAVHLSEKVCLYQLCLKNLEMDRTCDNQDLCDQLYRKLWMCRIREVVLSFEQSPTGEEEEDIFAALEPTTSDDILPAKELLCFGKMPKADCTPSDLTESEYAALGHLINTLLDGGHISQPCRLAAEFSFYSQDLAIIVSCVRLALDVVRIQDLEGPMIQLMSSMSSKHQRPLISQPINLAYSPSSLSLSSTAPVNWSFLHEEKEKVVVSMEILQSHCVHGNQLCKRILTCFIIACVLETDYHEVVSSREFDILKSLLRTECPVKFKLASDYLCSCSVPASQVAGFLCDCIVESYKVMHANAAGKTSTSQEVLFDPQEMKDQTSQFVKLCPDPSLLGDSLLNAVPVLSENDEDIPYHVLGIQTELLILSHQCHSAACNMEGISNVLRAAKVLTLCLQEKDQFASMVRLLTGIGRYNEMTFVFDSLKQNDCFHLLLKKGVEKEKSFKVAILDYLKRYHPTDRETFDMVAHNFMMHREIAKILEKRAQQALAVFKDIPLDNHTETRTTLESVVQFYTDAAESYCKEGCLRHAQTCVRQARLVALQLQFLPSGVKVIHLQTEAVDIFIASHSNFLESLIVSESYSRKNSWPDALCNNVIINGDFRYLHEFKVHIPLTPDLICESVERLQQIGNKTYSSANLKKFISYCKDIQKQLQLAQEFGFKDVILNLQKKDSASYVQDILSTFS